MVTYPFFAICEVVDTLQWTKKQLVLAFQIDDVWEPSVYLEADI